MTVEVSSTLADGLAVPKVGSLAFKVSAFAWQKSQCAREEGEVSIRHDVALI